MFTITWLIHNLHLPPVTELAICVMDRLLIDKLLSPLYRLLTESRLGEDIIGHRLDTRLLHGTFVVGIRDARDGCVDWMDM